MIVNLNAKQFSKHEATMKDLGLAELPQHINMRVDQLNRSLMYELTNEVLDETDETLVMAVYECMARHCSMSNVKYYVFPD